MNKEQSYLTKLVFTLSFGFLGLLNYPINGLAQSSPSTNNAWDSIQIRFQQQDSDGSSRGRPGRRGGTGSRGDCPPVDMQLTALIPSSNLGTSIEAHPTLWFYIPYQSSQVASAEFSLQDEQNNDVYRATFTPPGTPGTVSLSLAQAPPLDINKKYQWYVKIYCSQQALSSPVFIRSWVQRVALKPQLERQLQTATTPRARIAIYAQNGIWYSALTELAKLRVAEPQNATVNNNWANLLRDIGLENLAQKHISGEVNLQSK